MSRSTIKKTYYCPIELTIDIIGGKWKPLIMLFLREKPRRFGELKRLIPAVTEKMLTQQLRDLEQDHLLERRVYSETPLRVEYSLTETGLTLSPLLDALNEYGAQHARQYDIPMKSLDAAKSENILVSKSDVSPAIAASLVSNTSTNQPEVEGTSGQKQMEKSDVPLN